MRDGGQAIAPAQAPLCFAAAGASECLVAGYPPLVVAPEHSLVVLVDAARDALHVYPPSAQSVALVAVIGAPDGVAAVKYFAPTRCCPRLGARRRHRRR